MKILYSLVLIIIVSTLASTPTTAQQQIPRIGLLSGGSFQGHERHRRELLQGLEELGYVEGKNIIIEYRYAERKRDLLPNLAAELVGLDVSLIVAGAPNAIRAAMKTTRTIPIVMVSGGNVLSRGFVESLARPGDNVTGLRTGVKGLGSKRMELIKETFPSVSRVTVLNPRRRKQAADDYKTAGKNLGIEVEVVDVRNSEDLKDAFERITKRRPDGLIAIRNELTIGHVKDITEFANRNKLVSMYQSEFFVEQGGLMFYGINYRKMWLRAAVYVDKILKGANPATLPVEPPQLELVINLKTAEKIGVTIPPEILLEANGVIQ